MILIDGCTSRMQVSNFANLEEILTNVLEDDFMENRIVTDVLVNDEAFSELYPHQAEDIDAGEIQKLEIRSVSMAEMAADVTTELYKVITLMTNGAKRTASLFRQAEVGNALEVLQDVVDVTREFLSTVGLLRDQFSTGRGGELEPITAKLSDVIEEMCDIIEQEDWILLADLTEFEFLPSCQEWTGVLGGLSRDIAQYKAA